MNMNWYNFLKKTRAKVALHVNIPHEESGKHNTIYIYLLFIVLPVFKTLSLIQYGALI